MSKGGNTLNNKKELHGIINYETGEVKGYLHIKEGQEVKLVDTKQVEAHKNRLEVKEALKTYGDYFHLRYIYQQPIFKEMIQDLGINKANTHIIRLLKLASYLSWNNTLYDDNRHRIKKSSLSKIWGITNRTRINETFKLLTKYNYIYMEGDYIMVNEQIISKGAIKTDKNSTYTRVFIDSLQELYDNSEPKKRKQIAYLFNILPFIHYDWNILCWNPTEQDVDKLELMSWTDLASVCGIEADSRNISRLKKDLYTLRVNGNKVIGEFKTGYRKTDYKIVINPALFYAGSKIDSLVGVIKLFEAGESR